MQLSNFAIGDNYAICIGPTWFDLHNDYDFEKYEYDPYANCAVFSWARTTFRASDPEIVRRLTLRFDNLTILKTEFVAESQNNTDVKTLTFVDFLHSDDLNVMDGCLTQNKSYSTYHIIFRFQNGLAIKCFSRTVTCELES